MQENSKKEPESTKEPEKIFIGMGGWELPSFNSIFYPEKTEKGFRKLSYYSKFFDLVEVNATFYNTSLTPIQARRWLEDVAANISFIFTVKLFRGFTHTLDASNADALKVQQLVHVLASAGKLGGLVAQFPSQFSKTKEREEYFVKLQKAFGEFTLFIELRNRSWDTEDFYEFSKTNGLNIVNVDLPPLPGHMQFHTKVWNNKTYYRMMGRNTAAWNNSTQGSRYDYNYTNDELISVYAKIVETSKKSDRTYVVFHNDTKVNSLVNGLDLKRLLKPRNRFPAPANLIKAFPHLKTFCDPISESKSIDDVQLTLTH